MLNVLDIPDTGASFGVVYFLITFSKILARRIVTQKVVWNFKGDTMVGFVTWNERVVSIFLLFRKVGMSRKIGIGEKI